MSDEEFIEGLFKHGTIFLLDLTAFNAAALATTSEGRALVTQYAEAFSSPAAMEEMVPRLQKMLGITQWGFICQC